MRFSVSTDGKDSLGLRDLAERFANELWIPVHLTPDQATAFVRDQFRRTIDSELAMLEVAVEASNK